MADKKKRNLGDVEMELGDKFRKKWKEMDEKAKGKS